MLVETEHLISDHQVIRIAYHQQIPLSTIKSFMVGMLHQGSSMSQARSLEDNSNPHDLHGGTTDGLSGHAIAAWGIL